jgi:hypothetical protein
MDRIPDSGFGQGAHTRYVGHKCAAWTAGAPSANATLVATKVLQTNVGFMFGFLHLLFMVHVLHA